MTGGQTLTLLTLLVAVALFGWGVAIAYQIAWDDQFFAWLAGFNGKLRESDRTFIAWATVFMAFGGALAIVQAQQSVTGWFVKRELQRVQETFRDVEMALGTAAAEQFMAYKVQRMQAAIADQRFLNRIFG
ncbi:MAG TPA: hypothetical protein VIU82_10400 [Bosea sp. (in: a-proteobacteria)]